MNFDKALATYRLCWKHSTTSFDEMKSSPTTSQPPAIAARFSHAAITYANSMFIFGGGSSTTTTFNDLWRFDLSSRQWHRPLAQGTYPSPKACATIVCYADQLILFGGWRHPSSYPPFQQRRLFNELHVYNIKANRWTIPAAAMLTDNIPPPMTGHSVSVHNGRMIVFGGNQHVDDARTSSSNDIWSLNLETFVWQQVFVSGPKPAPRYGQFQVAIDESHALIMGGCGGPNNMFTDAWLLNMSNMTAGESAWQWQIVTVKNRKWAATHMWCNPACRFGDKLAVLGPTASVPSDFQLIRQHMPCAGIRPRQHLPDQVRPAHPVHRFNNHANQLALRPNQNQIMEEANRRLAQQRQNTASTAQVQPLQFVKPSTSSAVVPSSLAVPLRRSLQQSPLSANAEDDEAARRLRRNLHLRNRGEEDRTLPKRFDDQPESERVLGLAAFTDDQTPSTSPTTTQHERRLEFLRRMENKIRAMSRAIPVAPSFSVPNNNDINIRQSRRNDEPAAAPLAKRIKRNCIGLFVCDISRLLETGELTWVEYRNAGFVIGAPERLILSSLVAGNGELIMFGGLRKESLSALSDGSDQAVQVSNALHFLTFPRGVI